MWHSVCCYRQMHASFSAWYYVFGAWYSAHDLPLCTCTCTCSVYDAPHGTVWYVDNICNEHTWQALPLVFPLPPFPVSNIHSHVHCTTSSLHTVSQHPYHSPTSLLLDTSPVLCVGKDGSRRSLNNWVTKHAVWPILVKKYWTMTSFQHLCICIGWRNHSVFEVQ